MKGNKHTGQNCHNCGEELTSLGPTVQQTSRRKTKQCKHRYFCDYVVCPGQDNRGYYKEKEHENHI